MRCRHVQRRLVAYQDLELSPGENVRVREHLGQCNACRGRELALRSVTPEPVRPVRPVMDPDWSKLDRILDHASAMPVAPPSRWPRPMALLAYGAVAGALLGWGVHNWMQVNALEAQLAGQPAIAADADTATLPPDAIQPASWTPPEGDGAP